MYAGSAAGMTEECHSVLDKACPRLEQGHPSRDAQRCYNYPMQRLDTLLPQIIETLKERHATLTFAESCTGGKAAAALTSISGASSIFEGSMVTYSNRIKHEWLGVKSETLERYGAVGKECVKEMLEGILKQSGATYAMAISGIAGPTGGTPQKPVGTVYIGVASKATHRIDHFLFQGNRTAIQEQSVIAGYEMLSALLIDN